MTTATALNRLVHRRARQVWLAKPGHRDTLVTFDAQRQEFVIRNPFSTKPITLAEVLFQTEPRMVL